MVFAVARVWDPADRANAIGWMRSKSHEGLVISLMQLDGCLQCTSPPGCQWNTLILQGGISSLLKFVCCMHVRSRVKEVKMGKTSALTKKINNETKKPCEKRRPKSNTGIYWPRCRRFETNYFDKTSGFHSVMLSLCNGFQSGTNNEIF